MGSQALTASADFRELHEAGAGAGEVVASAMGHGADAVTSAAEAMGASTQEVAGIQALFEGAQAAAAYAAGNIPGGIAHTVAAGLYGAVAGGAGGSGASSGGASSASSSASSSFQGPDQMADMDGQRELMKTAHLEALREHDRGGTQIVNNIYQNNSSFFERDQSSSRRVNQTLNNAGNLSMSMGQING